MENRHSTLISLAGLLGLTLAMFGDALFAGGTRVLGAQATDLSLQFLSWRDFGFRELATLFRFDVVLGDTSDARNLHAFMARDRSAWKRASKLPAAAGELRFARCAAYRRSSPPGRRVRVASIRNWKMDFDCYGSCFSRGVELVLET